MKATSNNLNEKKGFLFFVWFIIEIFGLTVKIFIMTFIVFNSLKHPEG